MKTSPTLLAPTDLKPGWYENVPPEVYHSWDLCSNSRLSVIHKSSPMHLRHSLLSLEEKNTPALVLGEALHSAILEPELFDVQFAAAPECDKRTTVGKKVYADFCIEAAGKTHLTAEQFQIAKAGSAAVWANLDARIILESPGQIEITGIFDSVEGLRCKLRADKLAEEFQATVDVKSCICAHPRVFERDIYNHGYHRQGAFYVDGARALGFEARTHIIIAVEKEAPFASVVYELKSDALELGRQELSELKQTYKRCVESGIWPGYPEGMVKIGVPNWAIKYLEV